MGLPVRQRNVFRSQLSVFLQRLVHIYGPLVYNWARRVGMQPQDAADVAQETFAAVASRLSSFDHQRSGATFRGWLWTITRNKSMDWLRERGQYAQAAGGSNNLAKLNQQLVQPGSFDSDASSCDSTRSHDQNEVLHRTLAMVRSSFQRGTWQAFWRTVVDQCSPEQVAEELGVSKWTVYKARARVLQRLRSELDGLEELP